MFVCTSHVLWSGDALGTHSLINMRQAQSIALPSYSQSKFHMLMYYFGCRLEVAAKWLRSAPPDSWPPNWRKNMKNEMVFISGLVLLPTHIDLNRTCSLACWPCMPPGNPAELSCRPVSCNCTRSRDIMMTPRSSWRSPFSKYRMTTFGCFIGSNSYCQAGRQHPHCNHSALHALGGTMAVTMCLMHRARSRPPIPLRRRLHSSRYESVIQCCIHVNSNPGTVADRCRITNRWESRTSNECRCRAFDRSSD